PPPCPLEPGRSSASPRRARRGRLTDSSTAHSSRSTIRSVLISKVSEYAGQLAWCADHGPVTSRQVDEVESRRASQLGEVAGVDPCLGVRGIELRADES